MTPTRRILLVWLCGLAVWMAAASAAAQPIDRAAVERHLDAVFGADDRVIRKWPGDVHYTILGTPSRQHRDGVHRVMDALAAATGLAVDDVTGMGEPAGIVLYFTDTLDDLLPDPWLRELFGLADESLADFAARMRRRFAATGWMTSHSYNGDFEDVSLSLVNVNVANGDPAVLAGRMALSGFFTYGASDAIKPSVMNTGAPAVAELAPIDRALFAALYDDRIDVGELYGDVRPTLVDLVLEKLKGI
jgi:hypothetical protein